MEIQLSRGEGWIPLTGWFPDQYRACPDPWPDFTTSYAVVFFMFSMFVRFVDIDGIVDHHCLSSQLMIKVRSIDRLIHSPCVWFNVIMLSFFLPWNVFQKWRPVIRGIGVAQSLVFCVMFCWPFFVALSSFLWPLYFLSFLELLPLITPLVS
jgi:hypothetical protein